MRNEDVEGKVFLLENMSAVPEDSRFFALLFELGFARGKVLKRKQSLGIFMMQVDF